MSLPSRERGLKYSNHCIGTQCNSVAPFAGAWIEIPEQHLQDTGKTVAPFAGAWIEICGEHLTELKV